jgi:hypothetical protein
MQRRLVGIIDAGHAVEFSRSRSPIETLSVTFFANFERGVHVDFYEPFDAAARFLSGLAIGRNGRDQYDNSVSRQKVGDKGDATNVLVSIMLCEAEVVTKIPADLVPVEQLDSKTLAAQALIHGLRDGRFSGRAETGQPNRNALMVLSDGHSQICYSPRKTQ